MIEGFDIFWDSYPNKKGKQDAIRAWRALKGVTLDEILTGLDNYKKYKEDWKAWKMPGPWLRAGMWADEYAADEKARADVENAPLLTPEELDDWKRKYHAALMRQNEVEW